MAREEAYASAFDPADPSPLRTTLVACDGGVRAVVVHVSHMAVDHHGLLTLKREFFTLPAEAPGSAGPRLPPVRQPREQVALERQPQLRRKAEHARRYFRRVLADAPTSLLSTRRPRAHMRASRAVRLSTAVAGSAPALSRAHGVSVPSVLLGAVMLLTAAHAESDRVLLRSLFARRHRRPDEAYVAPQSLAALISCGVPRTARFGVFLRTARTAALRGYAHTDYDPRELLAEEHRAGQERGVAVDGYCVFNFMGSGDPTAIRAGSLAKADRNTPPQPGSGAKSHTASDGVTIPLDMQFIVGFAAGFDPGAISVSVTCDDAFLKARAPAFIDQVERLLDHAVAHPAATSDEVLRAAGLES
ncbi:hypothetical protein ACF06Q_07765 [Streptomyces leeuwenhoekii]|uniref:hypothetical protein n=1 Tax=Streptomyces leeuwenhoekii TaxID=1437453 RepID=UPI0036F98E1B